MNIIRNKMMMKMMNKKVARIRGGSACASVLLSLSLSLLMQTHIQRVAAAACG